MSLFLNNIKFENIFVLGSSLSTIDMPYFDFIRKKNPNANWIISYYVYREMDGSENLDDYHEKEKIFILYLLTIN